MELPARTREAEDAFVEAWLEVDDPDLIAEVVEAAVQARRMMLAARLVGLLGDKAWVEPGSDLERATRAASMFLLAREAPEDRSWSEFEDAWARARQRRMTRIKARMRDALGGRPAGGLNRLGKRRR